MFNAIHIGIFAQEESPTARVELAAAAARRGHTCRVVSWPTLDLFDAAAAFDAARILECDILYYRTGLGAVGVRYLERYLAEHGRSAVNLDADLYPYRERKTFQATVAHAAGVLVPASRLDTESTYEELAALLGKPFIAKADISSQGRDVFCVDSPEVLKAIRARADTHEFFFQTFIPHEHDCRVHVVGGRAVGGYARVAAKGDFRTNVHLGASMHRLSALHRDALFPLAEQLAAKLDLAICAVDFLPHRETGDVYFGEVNSNPGWCAADAAFTGLDVSEAVIDYFEALAHGMV